MTFIITITLLLLFNILFFLTGFILGRITSNGIILNQDNKPQSFFNQHKNKIANTYNSQPSISIDDTKVVVAIKTDGLEKKYQTLGNTQTSSENISDSVNKLKNLKK